MQHGRQRRYPLGLTVLHHIDGELMISPTNVARPLAPLGRSFGFPEFPRFKGFSPFCSLATAFFLTFGKALSGLHEHGLDPGQFQIAEQSHIDISWLDLDQAAAATGPFRC